ncbi:MAG TPA: ABC transporter permease [Roseiflexaceae bacterium]|nr:ABC transporter permease [Roseiflexaceae bacterium]HMP39125.1 ABC transporter permease [Roseiflexaceae bacterium]
MSEINSTADGQQDRTLIDLPELRAQRSLWGDALRKLVRNRLAVVGLIVTGLLLFAALFGPALAPYAYTEQNLLRTAEMPSADYWLGTDEIGRDMFSRVLYGARTAVLVAAVSTLISVVLGLIFGILAGYGGGWLDSLILRITDITMSMPSILLAALIAATIKQPIVNLARNIYTETGFPLFADTTWLDLVIVFGGLSLVFWPVYARLIRGQILSLREKEYIEAARASGIPGAQIALRHLLPNAIGPVIVQLTFSFSAGMVLESSLSYLGIGVQPPQASWGNMISSNIGSWSYRPWLVMVPAATLAIATLGVNFLGDGLNDALNPRSSVK